MSRLQNAFSPVFNAIASVAARRIVKRLAIIGSVALLALLAFAPPSMGQRVKLKNAKGSYTWGNQTRSGLPDSLNYTRGPYPIDSIFRYEGGNEYYAFYCYVNGIEEGFAMSYPTVVLGSGVGVTCTFEDTSIWWDNVSRSFSDVAFTYDRIVVQSKLGATSVPEACLDSATSAHFSYHLWLDGIIADSDATPGCGPYYLYAVSDSEGRQIDSGYYFPPDTLAYCPHVPTPGSYLARLSLAFEILDSFVYVPDTVSLSYHFIINNQCDTGNSNDSGNCVYQSLCKGLPWLNFNACYADVPDNVEYPPTGGTGWQGGSGIGVIQNSGMTIINNILRFNGDMSIDTVNTLLNADGEFYVYTMLPGGLYSGPFKLGTGTWPAFGYSCNWILPAANAALQSTPIAGFKLRIDSVNFISGGVSLGATVHIPGITIGGSCSSGTST